MKKRFVIIICMSVIFATCWGCESGNSKVDQVLQNQAQGGDSQQIEASRQAEDSQQADASRQAEDSQQAHASGDVTGTEGIDVDLTINCKNSPSSVGGEMNCKKIKKNTCSGLENVL